VACRNTNSGIWISRGTVERCVASDNAGVGITSISGTVTGCFTRGNSDLGITAGDGSVIGCTVLANLGGGIRVVGDCLVKGNTCSGNDNVSHTAAGIDCEIGGRARLEDNTCVSNGKGLQVTGARNFIVRNTCSGNTTNWSIVAGNFYGPIVDRTAVTPAAMSGNGAVSVLGSTDPNANFSY
jgi:parallel beta-helix repeat protein